MVEADSQETVAPPPDVPQLTDSLEKVAAAIDQARALGLPVSVPEPLYLACIAIINRHDQPDGGTPTGASSTTGPARPTAAKRQPASWEGGPLAASHVPGSTGVRVDDVPLRRLIWQVINPGEEFTVTDVADRMAALGASWPPSAVSNALGYWVSRHRLTRKRKGVYSYSQPPSVAADLAGDRPRQQESPAADPSRATVRGKGDTDVSIQITRREAAS